MTESDMISDPAAIVEPGEFLISIGGKQPGFVGRTDAKTTTTVGQRFTVSGRVTEVP